MFSARVSQGPAVVPGVVPGNPGVVPVVVVVVVLGPGTATSGLTPPLFSSVAPSGIVPPLRADEVLPGLDSEEAVPFGDTTADDVQPDVDATDPVEPAEPIDPVDPVVLRPALSKVEFVPVMDDVPIAVDVPPVPASPEYVVDPAAQPVSGAGLKPPGMIWVAPSGSPVGVFPLDGLAPSVPRGEVIPSADGAVVATPGMPVVVCANAAPQLSTSAAAIIDDRRIPDLLSAPLTAMIRTARRGTIKLAFRWINSNFKMCAARSLRLPRIAAGPLLLLVRTQRNPRRRARKSLKRWPA